MTAFLARDERRSCGDVVVVEFGVVGIGVSVSLRVEVSRRSSVGSCAGC